MAGTSSVEHAWYLQRAMARASAAAPTIRRMSLEEWGDLDEDEPGELVDGVLEDEEMPSFLHEIIVPWLLGVLRVWAERRGGRVAGSEVKIAVGPRRGRKADLSVFFRPHMPALHDAISRVPPYLVVEVVSPRPRDARRDRVDKLRDYGAAKVKHYWILDPQLRTLDVFSLPPRARRYVHDLAEAGGRLQRIAGFPGLQVDLDALWKHV